MASPVGRMKAWLGSLWPRWGGEGYGRPTMLLPGARRNWEQQAGDVWASSVPAIALAWIGDRVARPRPYVSVIQARSGEYRPLGRCPAVDLWEWPNAFYSRRILERAVALSLKIDGNAYVHVARGMQGRGLPAELWWIPHDRVKPMWAQDGSEYIGAYRVTIPGYQDQVVPASDMLHFRDGLDPRDERLGMSAIKACLREVCTLNEEASYTAALLYNSAVPGLMIIPEDAGLEPSESDAERIKARIRDTYTGDGRGGTVVMGGRFKVVPVGFSPDQLRLDSLPMLPMAKVAAGLGVPLMATGLPDPGKTYSNVEQAIKVGWGTIRSIHDTIRDTNRAQLLPMFGFDPRRHAWEYDYSEVEEMQEALDAKHRRTREDWRAGLITRNEARDVLGMEPDAAEGDIYYTEIPTARRDTADGESGNAPGDPAGPGNDAANGKALTNGHADGHGRIDWTY
jgi:HK97 family phage portal protein